MWPLLNPLRWKALPTVRLLLVNLLVAGLTSALLILDIEIFHRIKAPYRTLGGAYELPQFRQSASKGLSFVVDPSFGFRPVLGDGPYTRFGTLANDYAAAKPPGVNRLLFIGDSVTHRGQIVEALRAVYGSQKYEYWNAGVESFNTVQEVEYYKRFNRAINPDHVILTLHLNATPAFREDGTLVARTQPAGSSPEPVALPAQLHPRYWLGLVTLYLTDLSAWSPSIGRGSRSWCCRFCGRSATGSLNTKSTGA